MDYKKNSFGIPIAIVVIGLIIAGSLIYINNSSDNTANIGTWNKPITNNGVHIKGNADAPILITEYSDTQCPFCKDYHQIMQQVMAKYGDSVAWQYKHFPLDFIHPYARREAEAAECVAEIAGEDAYWQYIDSVFASSPSADRYTDIASAIGIDMDDFTRCVENDVFHDVVNEQYQDGIDLGAMGTPHSIISTKDGREFVLNGTYPFNAVSLALDMILDGVSDAGINKFLSMLREDVAPEEMQAFLSETYPKAIENMTIVE